MTLDLENVYDKLFTYCQNEDFAGHDPFDGLNSRLFQATPLKYLAPARLTWLQMVKRSERDLRPLLKVPKGVNPKGLALFASAEMSRFRVSQDKRHAANARNLLDRLLKAKISAASSSGLTTSSFGYNFDWQSRAFFVPIGMPAIVPTAFASQAFIEAYQLFKEERCLAAADEICSFIVSDLNRPVETDDEICFSYTPVDKAVIFNASLLAGESMARAGGILGNSKYLELAAKTVRFVLRRQRDDGAWAYGANAVQGWVDNFHTAYILLSLYRISSLIPALGRETGPAIERGIDFWLGNFFLNDGMPKYFDKAVYPVDIHSCAAAISTLSELRKLDGRMLPLAGKTAEWTIANMRGPEGFFYYQVRKNSVVKTPFMRWGQAWMAYAIARLIEAEK